MKGMFVLVLMTVGGWIGWAIGARFGIFAAFLVSLVGSAVGLYLAKRWTASMI